VDAAILFSDLLLPLEPLGSHFDFVKGEGPAIDNPLRSEADLARIRRFERATSWRTCSNAIKQIKATLAGRVPLIGFAVRTVHARVVRESKAALLFVRAHQVAGCTATRRVAPVL